MIACSFDAFSSSLWIELVPFLAFILPSSFSKRHLVGEQPLAIINSSSLLIVVSYTVPVSIVTAADVRAAVILLLLAVEDVEFATTSFLETQNSDDDDFCFIIDATGNNKILLLCDGTEICAK
jgi:hypothetical protein